MSASLTEIYDQRAAKERLRPDPAQREIAARLDPLRRWLERDAKRPRGLLNGLFKAPPAPPKGFYIWGGVGRGKSMLMDMFHSSVGIQDKRRVHFHAFMQEVHQELEKARNSGVRDAIAPVVARLAANLRLLSLDELQITDIADAMIVGRLFSGMFEAGVVVVATSNRPPRDLYRDGLNRALFEPFIALVCERMDVVELVAQGDYRQGRLEGRQVYFHPHDAKARAALAGIWDALTQGARGEPLKLSVQGREVLLPVFAGGVARASFWDLCGRALGAADYLALADAVRVLILEDIPRLSRRNYNEARRFVTLIDALYEARVRFIASAADRPENLYVEGSGSFEFERTVSRLNEMQSADWASGELPAQSPQARRG